MMKKTLLQIRQQQLPLFTAEAEILVYQLQCAALLLRHRQLLHQVLDLIPGGGEEAGVGGEGPSSMLPQPSLLSFPQLQLTYGPKPAAQPSSPPLHSLVQVLHVLQVCPQLLESLIALTQQLDSGNVPAACRGQHG